MGRGDQDKRERRAREQIDKALARRDVESAVDAVLALDKAAREPLLALVAPAFRHALPDMQKASAWARLHTLAARAEQEPRLLSHAADEATVANARWPLFLACMRARDFARAGRIWRLLVETVNARVPALARAITAWIGGQGHISPQDVADLDVDRLPALSAADPRHGTESRTQLHLAPPAQPTSSAAAKEALYLLFATQPPVIVAETLRAWLERAPTDVATTLRKQGGSLALRELLLQASSGTPLVVPAQLLARLGDGAKDDLAQEILVATRLLITRVASKTPKRGESEALDALASALVRTTPFEDLAEILARDFARVPELAALARVTCQSALSRAASLPDQHLIPLWIQALHLNAPRPEAEPEDQLGLSGPTWLQAASREVCRRGKALANYCSKLDGHARNRMLSSLRWGQPGEIVADIMDVLWKDASEEVRGDLARMLPDFIEMAEQQSEYQLQDSLSLADMATVERIALAASKADPDLPFLAAGGLSVWRRFGLRSLPYCAELLPYALSQASEPSHRFEIVQAYVGSRVDIDAWLEVIAELSLGEAAMLPSLMVETCHAMIERFRTDRIALAHAIGRIVKLDLPFSLLKDVAHAYQRAVLADSAEPTSEDEEAQTLLRLMLGDRPKKSPGKSRTKRTKKAPRKTDPRSGTGQLELPLDENDA
jgi:hypothetical protein